MHDGCQGGRIKVMSGRQGFVIGQAFPRHAAFRNLYLSTQAFATENGGQLGLEHPDGRHASGSDVSQRYLRYYSTKELATGGGNRAVGLLFNSLRPLQLLEMCCAVQRQHFFVRQGTVEYGKPPGIPRSLRC